MTHTPAPRRARNLRWFVAVGVLVCVLAALWVGFQTWQVQQRLTNAQSQADALQRALAAGEQSEASARLTSFDNELAKASEITEGFTWRAMGALPLIGNTFDSIDTVTTVGGRLSDDGLRPLVNASGSLSGGTFAPRDGRVPIGKLPELEEPVRRGSAAFGAARDDLAAQSLDHVPGRVSSVYERLQEKVGSAAASLEAADDALEILPAMLGQDGRRTYLLAVQNNAEVRSSGGMPDSQALLRARKGKLRLTDQTPASELGRFPGGVLSQSEAEREIYDVHPTVFPADTNFTPEFPRTAELMAAMWEKRKGNKLDGVITLDVVTLGYLLDGTGPVQGPDGPLTSDTLVDAMLYGANVKYQDTDDQNEYYEKVTKTVTQAVFAGEGNATKLLGAMRRGVMEGRVKVASFHDDEQQVLDRGRIAGQLPPTDTDTPHVGVYVNDATGSKMSYFLRYDVDVVSARCTDDRQELEAKVTFTYKSPEDPANLPDNITGAGRYGTPSGEQLLQVRVYGPAGGEMSGWTFDGEKIPVSSVLDRDRPVASPVVQLRPGEDVVMRWKIRSGPGQTDVGALEVTPSVIPGSDSGPLTTRCGKRL